MAKKSRRQPIASAQINDMQRLRRERMEEMDDHRRTGPLGEAFALGVIDEIQMEAARRFSSLMRRYSHIIDTRFVSAKVGSLEPRYGDSSNVIDIDRKPAGERTMEEQRELADMATHLRDEYVRVVKLLREAGTGCLREVTMVCLYAEPIASILALVTGLDAMVGFFGLEQKEGRH